MLIKSVNAIVTLQTGFQDVHDGVLGWVVFMIMSALFHMVPRMYIKREIYSKSLMDTQFWLQTTGIVFILLFYVDCRNYTRYDVERAYDESMVH